VIDIAVIVVAFNSAVHVDQPLASLDTASDDLCASFVFVDNEPLEDTVGCVATAEPRSSFNRTTAVMPLRSTSGLNQLTRPAPSSF
jgi:GT2 family glycosyltransferase